jgi:hypothetical protein
MAVHDSVFEPPQFLKFDFNSNPDSAFNFHAVPDPAFHSYVIRIQLLKILSGSGSATLKERVLCTTIISLDIPVAMCFAFSLDIII